MNCKPNDNAIVVRTLPVPCARGLLGRPVRVLSLAGEGRLGPYWETEGPHYVCACGTEWDCVPDTWLKPLPPLPPGEEDLYVSTPEEVAA